MSTVNSLASELQIIVSREKHNLVYPGEDRRSQTYEREFFAKLECENSFFK
jgi:hypothetical protein